MGSGRANDELTYSAKKPRERRRREAIQKKRLLALGVPDAKVSKMTTKAIRQMLVRPEKVRKQWAGKKQEISAKVDPPRTEKMQN